MSGHTSGPWVVVDCQIVPGIAGKGILGTQGTQRVPVASVYSAFSDVEDANAALIAAAPTLKAALRPFAFLASRLAEQWTDDQPIWELNGLLITVGDIRRAAAAIAKIEEVGT